MTTEKILQHIREVCGLKRLEFGCEVTKEDEITRHYIVKKYKKLPHIEECVLLEDGTTFELGELEIIGLPVHLEHLLYTIKNRAVIRLYSEGVLIEQNNKDTIYDLTRTVEQNLTDNTELRELIISLIK